jgi:hypothetical protein
LIVKIQQKESLSKNIFGFFIFLESYINLALKKKKKKKKKKTMNSKIQPQILQYFGQRATIQVN